MSVYIFVFITSSLFSFLYSKAKDKSARVIFLILCFMSLFIPAALRGGIGADYFSYLRIYKTISLGMKIHQEIGILFISKILQFFNFSGHALIVTYSFLSILFIFLAIPRKDFYLGIPIYVLVFYLDSYCLLRQALACSIMLFAYRKYFENKTKSFIFWSIIAVLNHKVMIIPIFLLFISKLVPKLNSLIKNFMYVFLFIFLFLVKGKLVSFLMTSVVGITPYANYALNKYAATESAKNSGLGFLLQIFILMIFVYLIDYNYLSKKAYKVSIIYLLYLLFVRCISQVLYILVRLVNSCTFVYVSFIVNVSYSKSRYRKILIVFLYFALTLLYIKGILGSPIRGSDAGGGKQIYPYTTIYNYKDNPVLVNRKQEFRL